MSEATAVIEAMGGIEVSKHQSPFCHQKVERLAARARINKPRVYVIPGTTPNACAVGLSPDDAAVAVTSGLLVKFDENEIEGVLAHEIAHIQRGHSIEKTKIAMKAFALATATRVGGGLIASSEVDFTPWDDDSDDLLSTVLRLGAGAATVIAGVTAASAWLTKDSLRSEFEADEFGGILSKKPWALARALKKIESMTQVGSREYRSEVSQLFIVSPAYLQYQTHPPTAERVGRLCLLEAEVGEYPDIPTEFCSTCGNKTDSDGKFCYWCGKELEDWTVKQ